MRTTQATNKSYQRVVLGSVLALAADGVLLAAMAPFRAHLSIATAALAFVVPVVVGVVFGGYIPGALASVVGFILYDIFFLPPYGNLTVKADSDWLALLVYLIVVQM